MDRAAITNRRGREPEQGLDALKEQQLLVRLVAELGTAQFVRGDGRRSERLWQEAALLGLDPERITHLLYGGEDLHDREALLDLDRAWCAEQGPARARPWSRPAWLRGPAIRPRQAAAVHRSARSAAAPARRAGR
ncbi:MAG: hypothetical protein ACKO5F_11110 [Synechococcus sp.]